ncbi:hypothetical protein, conserved [Leishmania tarentolae]|uniref:Uncharacterized protein n=1 Tax=Leishmania tarentolae TaxID=5689 RepID=A0A640KGU9_LEITA|nr:hypothetical protein, conserved [Leishmania tarentolae]
MFAATSRPSSTSSWRYHVQSQEDDLVRELMQASDVDAVLARMEGDHFRHLSPVMRKLTSYDADASAAPTSPRAGAPPPPPPPPEPLGSRTHSSGFGGSADWDAQSSPSILQHANPYVSRSFRATSPVSTSFHFGMHDGDAVASASSTARQPPPPPRTQASSSTVCSGVTHDPLDAYRRPAAGAAAAASHFDDHETELRYQTTIDSWLYPKTERQERGAARDKEQPGTGYNASRSATSQKLHRDPALRQTSAGSGMMSPPIVSSSWSESAGGYHSRGGVRVPDVTTQVSSTSPYRPSASLVGEAAGDIGGLENAGQSRIARQLQLLRNYRELAELCSRTDSPSTDLFRALPSEELARMQVEQLKGLAQREQSPITVNNNYYFDSGNDNKHGSIRRGRGIDGGRSHGSSDDSLGATRGKPNTGTMSGNVRSVSEVLIGDSHLQGMTGYRPSGALSPKSQRSPLMHLPRTMPLQSPQPSSGPDSPMVTPPLSQRGGNLAPPSPSRSQRGRSHCSRLFDAHYTPTATTEEAGSSYDEGNAADDEEDDYVGDCIGNGGSEDDDEYEDNGPGYRRPPPRIIEREQHRRFPNASNGDAPFPSSAAGGTAQPILTPTASQLEHQRHSSYSDDCVDGQSLATVNGRLQNESSSAPLRMRSGSAMFAGGGGRNSVGGAPGSDGGRYSVSSVINVLSGEQELRANAQRQSSGGRVNREDRRASQHPSVPTPRSHQKKRRSLSTGSSPVALRSGDAFRDPEVSPNYLSLHDFRGATRKHDGGTKGSTAPEKNPTGGTSTNGETAPCPEGDRYPKESGIPNGKSCYPRKDGARRRGKRHGAEADDDDNDSDGHNASSARSGISSNGDEDSACDTPGNPQLQTHKPCSSAQRKRHTSRHHGGGDVRSQRGKFGFGGNHSSATTRAYKTQRGRRVRGDGDSGNGVRSHGADDGGVDSVRSAASYSCSYTTSSDISDYVPGSYYSPIGSGHRSGGRRGARGGMISPGRPYRPSTQPQQPYPSSIRSPTGLQSRDDSRGRGRGGPMSGPRRVRVPDASTGVEGGIRQSLGSPGGYPALEGGSVRGGGCSPYQQQQQQRLRGGLHPTVGAGARGPNMAMVGGSAGWAGGMARLPDGRVVSVASPEARQYQQAVSAMAAGAPGAHKAAQMKMAQRTQYYPSPDVYPPGLPYAAHLGARPSSVAPSLVKGGRAASPSVAPSFSMVAHSNYGAGGSSAHIQPGLLYGSLLPKARPKTAMVVKNEQGRSHSVDPYGDANNAPLLDRGSVCPVQPAPIRGGQPWCLDGDEKSDVDAFPIADVSVNNNASTGAVPLAWKSSGSGCVVSRTGHVPVAPRGRLSSHYVPQGSLHQRNEPQKLQSAHSDQQQPGRMTVPTTTSPNVSLSGLPNESARPTAAAVSLTRKPLPQQQQQYQPPSATEAQRSSSMFSLQSNRPHYTEAPTPAEMYHKAIQSRRGSFGGAHAQQQSLYKSSNGTEAPRNATLQHFGIRSLQE